MSAHPPPIPPAQQPHHGPTPSHADKTKPGHTKPADVNTAEQGETANVKQNTTNQGMHKGRQP